MKARVIDEYIFLDSKCGVFNKRNVIIAIILNWLVHVEL